jgi:phosphatidylinositol alpha-1,6-mannosyltransferase
MKVLFITRKYPPQIGGMESFSYGLINNIQCGKDTVILNKKQINLIWWLPYAFIISLVKTRKADVIHLGDGLLAPIGLILKKISRRPVAITVHGLDVTYNNWFYQKINAASLKYLDKVICVSESTRQDCLQRHITENKLIIIPDGINGNKFSISNFQFSNKDKKILLTVGRLVKRKGHEWFIREVMPQLEKNIQYWIVGKGPEKGNIEKVIQEKNLQNRVKLLGFVSEEKIKEIYHQANLFIMPNIEVKGDREGFGIVALEASASGLPVVASDLEGLKDAIIDGQNGFLVKAQDKETYTNKINSLLHTDLKDFKIQAKKYTLDHYNWPIISQKYLEIFKKTTN